jgi:hypothetical protein
MLGQESYTLIPIPPATKNRKSIFDAKKSFFFMLFEANSLYFHLDGINELSGPQLIKLTSDDYS